VTLPSGEIPLWVKVAYTLFLCVLVPVYWRHYGPKNFLWFSDIALLTTAAALWLESALLTSMMTLAVALPELAWNVDFFGRMLSGRRLISLSDYMFDSDKPLYLRALSLFHVALPALLLWMLYRLAYDGRAWAIQSAVSLVVLPVTYWVTDPAENVNWVRGLAGKPQRRLGPRLYLALLMAAFPLALYLPAHLVLRRLFGR
jgi:hypothetical protein